MDKQWPKVQLGEVLRLDLDRVPIEAATSYPMVGVLSFGRGLFNREPVEHGKTSYRIFYRLKAEHVVMSQLFGWEGALALSSEQFAGKFLSPQFPTFLCDNSKLAREYLGWLMRRPAFWEDLASRAVGMGDRRRTLTPAALFASVVPLPSLAEQRRIVARIEEVAAKIEEARRWRRDAATEVEALMPSALGNRFSSLAVKHSVRPLSELSSHILDGPHVTPKYLPDGVPGIPFVTVKNIVTGRLDFRNLNYISDQDHETFTRRCKPELGDVLYSKDGATRGRACFVDSDREFSFFVSVALIKPLREVLDSRFLVYLLNSNWIKDRMLQRSRGDMIPHIVLREIRAFPVPDLTISQQRVVVAELDELQEEADALKRLQAESKAELDSLLPAILDRAFRREL
jgi:type I restriction enzyme S subunit